MARLRVSKETSNSVVMDWKHHPAKKGHANMWWDRDNYPGHLHISMTCGPFDLMDFWLPVGRETPTLNIYIGCKDIKNAMQ